MKGGKKTSLAMKSVAVKTKASPKRKAEPNEASPKKKASAKKKADAKLKASPKKKSRKSAKPEIETTDIEEGSEQQEEEDKPEDNEQQEEEDKPEDNDEHSGSGRALPKRPFVVATWFKKCRIACYWKRTTVGLYCKTTKRQAFLLFFAQERCMNIAS